MQIINKTLTTYICKCKFACACNKPFLLYLISLISNSHTIVVFIVKRQALMKFMETHWP